MNTEDREWMERFRRWASELSDDRLNDELKEAKKRLRPSKRYVWNCPQYRIWERDILQTEATRRSYPIVPIG